MIMVSSSPRDFSQATTSDIVCRIASSRADREAAFRLVYNAYLQAGLATSNSFGLRVTPYHLLPTTEIFIATYQEEVIFTLSLIIDGDLGIPLEAVFPEEVAERRQQGILVSEVSCLADRRANFRGSFPVFVRLCRLMAQYAWRRGVDELLIAVHPRHAKFYQRFMHFHPIAPERSYPTVQNHPAVALGLNFDWVDRERPRAFDTFFGEWLPDDDVRPCPISEEDREFFAPMVDPAFTTTIPAGFTDCRPSTPALAGAL